MTARDWAAKLVEERGQELAESFPDAARQGDRRAADALMNRIYGRPEAALVADVPPNPAVEMIRSLPLEEKHELLSRLQRGEVADTASALPTVEAVTRAD
jgi:hypothetical protein